MKFSFNLNIKNKIIIFSSIFGIIIIGSLIFGIYPLYKKISELNTNLYDQRVQLAIYEKQRLNLDETRKEYKNIETDINNITSVLVKNDDLLIFIDSIDILAKKNNLKQIINLSEIDNAIASKNLQVNLSLTGSWEGINNYLYELENLNYYVLLDNLIFDYSENNITTRFNLSIYLQ